MRKQLEMFLNLTQQIPQNELEKLQQLAASSGQDNIDLCCTLLNMYNYTFTQKCVFVFEQQINTISLEDWINNTIVHGEPVERIFKVDNRAFLILDGYVDINQDIYLKLIKDGMPEIWELYSYNDWIGNEQKDRPTVKSRAIQVKQFKKLFSSLPIKFWYHGNNK